MFLQPHLSLKFNIKNDDFQVCRTHSNGILYPFFNFIVLLAKHSHEMRSLLMSCNLHSWNHCQWSGLQFEFWFRYGPARV